MKTLFILALFLLFSITAKADIITSMMAASAASDARSANTKVEQLSGRVKNLEEKIDRILKLIEAKDEKKY